VESEKFRISKDTMEEINGFLLDPGNPHLQALLRVVAKYGTPEEINAKAKEARCFSGLMDRLGRMGSPYLEDLKWLADQRDKGAFIPISSTAGRSSVMARQQGLSANRPR
jgi:hypothetical protein